MEAKVLKRRGGREQGLGIKRTKEQLPPREE